MKTYSLNRGGIFYEDPFAPPRDTSVLSFLPSISIIPMRDNAGLQAFPVVSVGNHVEEGALIARGQGTGSANIYAPVPGTVISSINNKLTNDFWSDALVIRLEGKFDRLGRKEIAQDWQNFSPFEMRKLISENGIVEMDGEGRPVRDVFSEFDAARSPFSLVVRCVFDDPWRVAEYCVCRERLEAVAAGCVIAAKASGAAQIVFAVSDAEADLGKALESEVGKFGGTVTMVFVSSKYPQAMKTRLEASMRNYEKSEAADLGPILILGPSTLAAIADAVQQKKPILDRYVAVGGSAVSEPRVLKVRIGSRLKDVFNECGGFSKTLAQIAIGSPLLGRTVQSLDEPILKTSYAIFASAVEKHQRFTKKLFEKIQKLSRKSCLGCGECRRVCPEELDPEDIYKRICDNKHSQAIIPLVMKCNGCGCCEAVCPSKLPLCTAIVRPAFGVE